MMNKTVDDFHMRRLRQLKLVIILVASIVFGALEFYHTLGGRPLVENPILYWLVGMGITLVVIEGAFRAVMKLQERLQKEVYERRRSEEALRSETDKLRILADGLAGMGIGIDIVGRDHRILDQNRILSERFGDCIGGVCYERYFGRKGPCDPCLVIKALESGTVQSSEFLSPDGRTYESLSAPLADSRLNGHADRAIQVVRDITERKKSEEQLARAKQLEKLDEMRSVLLASVSHELRTPLTSIKGLASTLIQPDVKWDHDTEQDFLRTIAQESDRLAQIVSDLIDMTQLEAGIMRVRKAPVRITVIVDHLKNQLESLACNHQLEVHIPPDLPIVDGDEVRIGQVIINLVSNATAYSDKGTTITLAAKTIDNEIVVSVADEGVGIPDDHLTKVFDRFYRMEEGAKRRRGGSGLGLSISKGITEAHGGRIWVQSQPGQGATFSFSLPVIGGA
ncbi:MAG: ATP-binding protein [Dehalococcoidia bacterium]|nr:ATP-binding protein [Dehalococcoidia bacterium]